MASDPGRSQGESETSSLAIVKDAIPETHAEFIGSFADTLSLGDYLVRPCRHPPWDRSVAAKPDRPALDPLPVP